MSAYSTFLHYWALTSGVVSGQMVQRVCIVTPNGNYLLLSLSGQLRVRLSDSSRRAGRQVGASSKASHLCPSDRALLADVLSQLASDRSVLAQAPSVSLVRQSLLYCLRLYCLFSPRASFLSSHMIHLSTSWSLHLLSSLFC